MTITVNGPNGITINFPDGTDADTIHGAMSQAVGGAAPTGPAIDPKAMPGSADTAGARSFSMTQSAAPQPDPLAAAADARVKDEAAKGLIPSYGSTPLPSVVNAIPFKNDLMAGGEAALNALSGGRFGSPFDEAKAYQDARDRYVETNNPKGQLAANIAGGLAMAPSLPAITIAKGGGLVKDLANLYANVGLYSGLYGAGDSSGDGRVVNALASAKDAVTSPWTPALYFGGKTLGNALEKRAVDTPQIPAELSKYSPSAVGTVSQLLKEDELHRPITGYGAQASELGPRGMLADMGPNSRAVLAAAAKRTGPDTTVAVKSIAGRKAGALNEINSALDATGGKAVNVPMMIDQMKAAKQAAAKPLYDAFRATSIPINRTIGNVLKDIKVAAPGAISKAQKLAAGDGYHGQFKITEEPNVMTPMTGINSKVSESVPQGIEYDYIKRSVDDLAKGAAPGSNEQRIYSNLASRLREAVDTTLSPADPAKSSWAQARKVAGEHLRLEDAVEAGPKVFDKNYSVDRFAYDLRKMSPEERKVLAVSARSWLKDRVADMASTKAGENGDTALRSLLQSAGAKQKLQLLFGNKRLVDNFIRTLHAETVFDNTYQKVLQNSDTALYQKAQERLPGKVEKAQHMRAINIEGLVAGAGQKMIDLISSEHISARDEKHVADVIKMLTAQGADRHQIYQGLMKVVSRSHLTPTQKLALQKGARHSLTLAAVPQLASRP
jgi:hypothetical protein